MKKQFLKVTLLSTVLLGGVALLHTDEANAHGYVEQPTSRGYQGSLDKNVMGWSPALQKYGNVITNPQSLEYLKGFPQAGPSDGRIASAEGGLGQIGDNILDEAGLNRWTKNEMKTGANTITWHYTAPHSTAKWHYYMTKSGWDANKPLERKDLELISEVKHDGSTALNNKSHNINIPEDRSGYHVILAVWDVADTPNAFYNVIDVDVNGTSTTPPVEEAPAKPENVKASNITTSSIQLAWNKVDDAKEYNVYRDGSRVKTVSGTQMTDIDLKEATTYSYQVEAVGNNGKVSEKSATIKATTASSQEEDNQKPTMPTHVHSMATTDSSVDLMWTKSSHFLGVKHYEVYRDGAKVATTTGTRHLDKGLKANTTYKYQVRAISVGGNASEFSTTFVVQTKEKEASDARVWKLGSFTKPEFYQVGEKVRHNGKDYTVVITHTNYGDDSWAPGDSVLFK